MSDEFKFTSNLEFPVALKGQVIFNEEVIKMICQIVGIDSLDISSTEGRTVVTISGFNADGSATMGKAKDIPDSFSSLENLKNMVDFSSMNYSNGKILLDLKRIEDELLSNGANRLSERNSELWARKLNSVLKRELLKLILEKQKSNVTYNFVENSFLLSFLVSFGLLIRCLTIYNNLTAPVEILEECLLAVGFSLTPKIIFQIGNMEQRKRISIFLPYSLELDRALIASFLVMYHTLVAGVVES